MRNLEEALSEVERENQVRARIYAKWIQEGKISRIDAKDRQERMIAAEHYLRKQFDLQATSAEEQDSGQLGD